MTEWVIKFTTEAEDDFVRLDIIIRKRVIEKLLWLKTNFAKIQHKTLSNKWKGFYKLRIGDWRVIYEIEHNLNRMIIHRIERRDKVYKI